MKKTILVILIFIFFVFKSHAEVINDIKVEGNKRISKETIVLFSGIKINQNINDTSLNEIIKNLYSTNFFENISVNFNNGVLIIKVSESPIIQTILFEGIKKQSLIDTLKENLNLKEKNSFADNIFKKDQELITNILRSNGYYFAEVNTKLKTNNNNTIDIIYNVELGDKAYIKSIKFIGDKKIKDRKLRSVILSEEAKFWKIISNKKFLDIKRINLDEKLLKSYYKNKGYFNVSVESSSAQIINDRDFELIYNINAGEKYYFDKLTLNIPDDYPENSFKNINDILINLNGEPYSFKKIEDILDEIDEIAQTKDFEFVNVKYSEETVGNKLNLNIKIEEGEKFYIERINIYGNYITEEKVIRNSLIIDEGDALNNILLNKSINEVKAKNIFKSVKSKTLDGSKDKMKLIEIEVEEKPTGEIFAGAGTGTSGSSFSFGIKENNYLGKGIKLDTNFTLSDETSSGSISIFNPNYKNTDRTIKTQIERSVTDLMSSSGYETNKTGFSIGTSYEQLKDLYFSPSVSSYYESIDTSSAASAQKKKQAGDFFESSFSYGVTLNKLNQNFQPSDGYKSSFFQSIPMISDDYTLENVYKFSTYHELKDDMILSFNLFTKAVNTLSNKDVRLSKRVVIPGRRLRGFEKGKIGPKDNNEYVGGNYGSAVNISTTLPNLFEEVQNLDLKLFIDAANVWGVDYNSNLDNSKLRSSTGLAIDWWTPIGPLSFSLSEAITKADTDKTERFRFQIGTTF
tara:strand:- start:1659 stop:3890 length:2232 start_codon:yes stop_codon:yes gene_type:complete